MKISRRMFAAAGAMLALAASIGLGAGPAVAEYPEKPVRYIIPFGPGGESDITARLQQPFFQKKFGQDLVIEYKPGGGGAVGWSGLNSLPADGYTIMGVNLPHIVLQPLQKDVGYKTDELSVIYWFHYTPDAIVVQADSEFKTLQDLIDYAKKNPGKLTFSGSGKGSANNLAQVRFDKMAGVKSTYVAFKGTGASVTALLGGQVSAAMGYSTVAAKQGDQVRMLAVATEERLPAFPDVPTFKELGIDLVSGAYRGIAVPKSTPDDIKEKLSGMIAEINKDPDFIKKMNDGGFAMSDVSVSGNAAFMKKVTEEITAAAKEGGILK